jgi:hypothetical protein
MIISLGERKYVNLDYVVDMEIKVGPQGIMTPVITTCTGKEIIGKEETEDIEMILQHFVPLFTKFNRNKLGMMYATKN